MKTTRVRNLLAAVLLGVLAFTPGQAAHITPAEARAIAREAYIYGYAMVDSYRIQYAYFVDTQSPEFKAPWNQIRNIPRVYTPEDKAVQVPNSDTPYSMMGLDLRAEPIVLSLPAVQENRYFSVQLIDAYTHNFAYLGSRTSGNRDGSFLITGPGWKGQTPKGVKQVIRAETDLVLAVFRTQLFNPADLENVKQVQAGYQVRPLSAFLGKAAAKAAPPIDFIKPLTPAAQKTSPEIFDVLNFILEFCPTHPSEKALMKRFARIGVGSGRDFNLTQLSPEMQTAIEQGIADAWADFSALKARVDAKEVTSGDLFGTREYLKNNYLYRMAAAVLGIFGNSKQEAMYPMYFVDAAGQKLVGSHRYTLRFAPGQMPPVNAFWSLTMYELPSQLLVDNPINRYLLNSPMLPQFKFDADGSLTLHIQNDPPGADKEANWLPAPKGPFFMAMRLYWPKSEAIEGKWVAPPAKLEPAK